MVSLKNKIIPNYRQIHSLSGALRDHFQNSHPDSVRQF